MLWSLPPGSIITRLLQFVEFAINSAVHRDKKTESSEGAMGRRRLIVSLSFVIFLYSSVPPLHAQSVEATAASYVEMGNDFARHGNNKLALGAYTIALDYAPKFAPAYFGRAVVHQQWVTFPWRSPTLQRRSRFRLHAESLFESRLRVQHAA
jgi:hypothetical protein